MVADVLWLNVLVLKMETIGTGAANKLTEIEGQINYLAAQAEIKVATEVPEEGEKVESEVGYQMITTSPAVTLSPLPSEVFIPLGSGSTHSTEWVDTGAQAYVDASIYPRLKEVYLQATLRANSGTAFVRIGAAEISHNTPTSTFKISNSFQLGNGNRLYVVQIRSENGQEVFVENARLRLVL